MFVDEMMGTTMIKVFLINLRNYNLRGHLYHVVSLELRETDG